MGYDVTLRRSAPIAGSEFEDIFERFDSDLSWGGSEGEIIVYKPNDEHLEVAVKIADRLGAQVFGDDGERYWIEDGELVDDRAVPPPMGVPVWAQRIASWWWFAALVVLAIVALMLCSSDSEIAHAAWRG